MKKIIILGVFLGFGLGLIFSSSFSILFMQKQSSPITPEYIKSEAKKLGMIDPTEYFNKN